MFVRIGKCGNPSSCKDLLFGLCAANVKKASITAQFNEPPLQSCANTSVPAVPLVPLDESLSHAGLRPLNRGMNPYLFTKQETKMSELINRREFLTATAVTGIAVAATPKQEWK